MRRTTPLKRWGMRTGNPFQNLTTEQLTYIGAIAMLYNDVEGVVNDLCAEGLQIPIRNEELLTRINGIEGKYEIIKLCAKHWGLAKAPLTFLAETLGNGGVHGLKKWRDGVIHARMFDAGTSVGKLTQKQGRTEDVLLSLGALTGLYNRLDQIRSELYAMLSMLQCMRRLNSRELDDQHRERLEREVPVAWAQAQECRSRRLSLPPMPEFPEDTLPLEPMPKAKGRPAHNE